MTVYRDLAPPGELPAEPPLPPPLPPVVVSPVDVAKASLIREIEAHMRTLRSMLSGAYISGSGYRGAIEDLRRLYNAVVNERGGK